MEFRDVSFHYGADRPILKHVSFEVLPGQTVAIVEAQYQDAVSSGGNGTPFPIVITPDGIKIALLGAIPFEGMKQLIDGLLAKK